LLKPAVKELDERVLAVRYFHITCCLIELALDAQIKRDKAAEWGR